MQSSVLIFNMINLNFFYLSLVFTIFIESFISFLLPLREIYSDIWYIPLFLFMWLPFYPFIYFVSVRLCSFLNDGLSRLPSYFLGAFLFEFYPHHYVTCIHVNISVTFSTFRIFVWWHVSGMTYWRASNWELVTSTQYTQIHDLVYFSFLSLVKSAVEVKEAH